MSARFEEEVITSFRINAEALRDLHAITRQRCDDIDPTLQIQYEVRRRDALRYLTNDIEDVIKERNGKETRVTSIELRVDGNQKLKLSVMISDSIVVNAEAEDRARLLVLVSDIRNVIRERMRGRRGYILSPNGLLTAFIVSMLVFFGIFQAITSIEQSKRNERYNHVLGRYNQKYKSYEQSRDAYDKKANAIDIAEQNEIDGDAVRARQLSTQGSTDERLAFLVQNISHEIQREKALQDLGDSPNPPSPPSREATKWWEDSFVVAALVPIFLAIITTSLVQFRIRPEAIFLIGERVDEQARWDSRRDKFFWGVVVALLLGILSSLISAYLLGG